MIDAKFQFQDGHIAQHRDRFSFWRWSSQSLGTTGIRLAWTPLVRHKVRNVARARLDKFIQAHPAYP